MKHPSVEAWVQFQKENPTTFDPKILHNPEHLEFLMNRLHKAFCAGYADGTEAERKRITDKIVKQLTD